MAALLRDVDVMVDVLGFLTRREIAFQLASVNVAFSALCNCSCQQEEEAQTTTAVGQIVKLRKWWNLGSKCKKLTVNFSK